MPEVWGETFQIAEDLASGAISNEGKVVVSRTVYDRICHRFRFIAREVDTFLLDGYRIK